MKIHIGTDHAGFELKNNLVEYLKELGHDITDHGSFSYNENDDYPDFIMPVAHAVAIDGSSRGIILGGSGQGEMICANKQSGIRAGIYYGGDLELVKLLREHNDANILSLGARFVSEFDAKYAVKLFIETAFSNDERHVRRLSKFQQI